MMRTTKEQAEPKIHLSRIAEIDAPTLRILVATLITVGQQQTERIKELEIQARRAYQRGYTAGKLSAIRRWTQRTGAGKRGAD